MPYFSDYTSDPVIVTPPVIADGIGDVITVAEAKRHLRIDVSDPEEDEDIAEMIAAARERIEFATKSILLPTTYRVEGISLPQVVFPVPLLSVDSITYLDSNGVTQPVGVNDFQVGARINLPGWVALRTGYTPPNLGSSGFKVTYTAGRDPIPACAKRAAKLLVGEYYRHREAITEERFSELPQGIRHLIAPLYWGGYF